MASNLLLLPMAPEIISGCVLVRKKNQPFSQAASKFAAYVRQALEREETSTSVTKYLIVSLVYFSDSTWQKSSMYPAMRLIFAWHSRRKIRRNFIRLFLYSSLVPDFVYNIGTTF